MTTESKIHAATNFSIENGWHLEDGCLHASVKDLEKVGVKHAVKLKWKLNKKWASTPRIWGMRKDGVATTDFE